jgi:opacity protein-like surface antigen
MSKTLKLLVLLPLSLASQFSLAQSTNEAAPAAPLHSWAGYHFGVDVGSQIGNSNQSLSVNDPQQSLSGQGANADQSVLLGSVVNSAKNSSVAGFHVERLFQQDKLVYGVAANLMFLGCKTGSNTGSVLNDPNQIFPNYTSSVEGQSCLNNFSSLTAKVGRAVGNALFFVDGGLAVARLKYNTSATITNVDNPGPADVWTGSGSKTMMGYVIGTGVQYAITKNVSAGVNLNFYDLGKTTYNAQPDAFTAGDQPGVYQSVSARAKGKILKLSVDYQF